MSQQEQQRPNRLQRQIDLKVFFQVRESVFTGWTEQQFAPENSKCEFNNPGRSVCTNPECTYDNPFMCRHDGCQCISHHQGCSSHQVEFIQNKMKRQSNLTVKLQEEAEKVIDSFFKELLHQKDLFKFRFSIGIENKSFESQINSQCSSLEPLLDCPITGKSISELLKLKDESIVQKKIDQKVENLRKSGQNFLETRIKPFVKHLQNIIFFQHPLRWGPSYPSLIENQTVNQNPPALLPLVALAPTKYSMKLISPGVIYITGKIVKCRLRVESLTNSVVFGIGLSKKIQSSQSKPDKLQNLGCFITESGQIYVNKVQGKSERLFTDIRILPKDVIMMEFDKKDWKLKFKNERNNLSFEVKISFIPEIENDQYHFFVGLTTPTDQVDLLGDIEGNLPIQNEENADRNRRMVMN